MQQDDKTLWESLFLFTLWSQIIIYYFGIRALAGPHDRPERTRTPASTRAQPALALRGVVDVDGRARGVHGRQRRPPRRAKKERGKYEM